MLKRNSLETRVYIRTGKLPKMVWDPVEMQIFRMKQEKRRDSTPWWNTIKLRWGKSPIYTEGYLFSTMRGGLEWGAGRHTNQRWETVHGENGYWKEMKDRKKSVEDEIQNFCQDDSSAKKETVVLWRQLLQICHIKNASLPLSHLSLRL